MGVDRNDYIIVGVDIGADLYDYDSNEDLYETYSWNSEAGEIIFINDVYGYDYFIVGEILQAADGYRKGLDYSLFGKEQQIEMAKMRVKAFIKEHFDVDCEPHVIVKTRWS